MRDVVLIGGCAALLLLACSSSSTTQVIIDTAGHPGAGVPASEGDAVAGHAGVGGGIAGGPSASAGTLATIGGSATAGASTTGGALVDAGAPAIGGTSPGGATSGAAGTSSGGATSGTAGTSTSAGTSSGGATSGTAGTSATAGVVQNALAVAKSGTGDGAIDSNPSGISCGSTCSAQFPSGATVTLNATPASGSAFVGWSGACSGTGGCVVTLSDPKSVTAAFDAVAPQTINFQPGPDTAMDTQIVFAEGPSQGSSGNNNFGMVAALGVGCYDHNTIIRTLLRFELSANIRPGKVVSAQLVLEPSAWSPKDPVGPLSIYVHKMLKSWKQGTAGASGSANSAAIDGATGSERYFGSSWSVIGIGQDDVDATSTYVSYLSRTYDKNSPDMSQWSFDVTAYVSDWATNPPSNFGFLLKSNEHFSSATEDGYSFPQFHSGESSEATKRPKLVVTVKP